MQTILGLDFGSSNIVLVMQNEGLILKESNLVSVRRTTNGYTLECVGNQSNKLLGKTGDNITTFSPVGFGEIVSFDYAVILLKQLLEKIHLKPSFLNPIKLVLLLPVGMQEQEIQKYMELCHAVKIKDVVIVPGIIASALGENINISANSAKMVMDIGGGTIDCAVINMNHVVCGSTLALGGRTLDSMIVEFIQKKYGVTIGLKTAQNLKEDIGSLYQNDSSTMQVSCIDNETMLVDTIEVSAKDVFDSMTMFLDELIRVIETTIIQLPPELAADVTRNGITITGGYSKIVGLEKYLRTKLGINILVSNESDIAAQKGLTRLVNNINLLETVTQK